MSPTGLDPSEVIHNEEADYVQMMIYFKTVTKSAVAHLQDSPGIEYIPRIFNN